MFYQGPPGLMVDLVSPSPNGVDVMYSHAYAAERVAANRYIYAANNPLNVVDPSGLQAAPGAQLPVQMPLGAWWCVPGGQRQTTGRPIQFKHDFIRNCVNCTEMCRIQVTAFRCFHESVRPTDDRDINKFFTTFQVSFERTGIKCGDEKLKDVTTYQNGCTLWPGRFIFPNGPLSVAVLKYLYTVTSCEDFKFNLLCDEVKKVPPGAMTLPR